MNWKYILPFLVISFCYGQQELASKAYTTSISFIENKGQFDGRNWRSNAPILYSISYNPFNIYFSADGWTYRFDKIIKNPKRPTDPAALPKRLNISELIHVKWINSNPNVQVIAEEKLDPYYTYGVFDEQKKETSIPNIRSYRKITYKNLYDKIDVEYLIHPEGGVKYNVILHPGANPNDLQLNYTSGHTSTLNEKIEIQLNRKGQIEINTSLGSVIEHAPITFYQDGSQLNSSYKFDGHLLSFHIEGYDNSKTVIIDPWIISPNFVTSTSPWEVETDAAGNVYSIGGETPMELKKYDINGALQWTYVTPWDTNNVWLGTLATDPAGTSFITSGTSPTVQRVNTAGGLVWSNNHSTMSGPSEFWSITFNCDYSKLIIGGTHANIGLFLNDFWAAIYDIDITNGNILNTQLFDQVTIDLMNPPTNPLLLDTPIEVRSIASSKNSQYVYLTHISAGKITDNFTFCGDNEPIFHVDNQKNLGYKCENYLPETQNGGGLKGVIAGDNYFYTHGGNEIRRWDINTGALVNVAALPGGSSATVPIIGGNVIHCSGLAVDDCGNIYAGSMNQVVQFDENLAILSSQPTNFNVYDVAVNSNGEVIACGAQQNNAAVNRNGRIESLNFSACGQFSLICCDANFCNPGPLCITDASVTLDVSTPGGTWSGVGVNASGVFDPAIAGIGEHIITYTIACGQEQHTVLVSPCQPLDACLNANGTITITNGVGTIVWEETIAPSSSPITNQTECENCGHTWLPAIPFVSPAQCLDGSFNTVTTCNSPGGLQQFATGTTVLPSANLPIIVTDAAGNQTTINNINDLDDCVVIPCTNLTMTISSQTNVLCNGDNNGSATVVASGGNGNYTYTWQPGSLAGATQTGLSPGTYTVDAEDSDACAGSITVTITEPLNITLTPTITNSDCGFPNGEVEIQVTGGTSPYTFLWSTGGTTPSTGLVLAGAYSVTVTDANGCTVSGNFAVSSTDGPDITLVTSEDASCFGLTDGSATVTATGGSGGYTYTWQPGNLTGPTQNSLGGGVYTVTVVDSDGCPSSLVVTINQPNQIQLDLGATPSSCTVDDGSISVSASGGSGIFTYLWSNGATTNNVSNIGAGNYTVTVTDGSGCQVQGSVNVSSINGPVLSLNSVTDETCLGSADGSATVAASAGTPGYTYAWSPTGGVNATATGLTAGTYNITVTDAAGCIAVETVTIGSGSIDVEVVPDSPVITNGDEVTLNVVINPNSPGATFVWTPSDGLSCSDCQNPIASPSQTTTYQVTVITAEGCIGTATVTVFVEAPCQQSMVPSTFSPNGDGLNDFFCVLGNCVQSMELSIYNRWGEQVFKSESQTDCWDGTHRDKPVNSGVFVYKLRVIDTEGEEHISSGNVTLVR